MKLLKEPLLHFLLLGAVLFGLNAWRTKQRPDAAEDTAARIAINAAIIDRLGEGFSRQWHRRPDAEELRGLVNDYLREEVLYREALAMGLDRDDTIVRRRMAQKMEFLSEDIASAGEPDDASLRRYFDEHAARYAKPVRVSFRHVYFSRQRRGARAETDAQAALDALVCGALEETIGDPFLREYEFSASDEQSIAAALGKDFAAQVMMLPPGEWRGPVASSYGAHLVRVSERTAPTPVLLTEVREQVVRDFNEDRRRMANREVFERLKQRYQITVDESSLTRAAGPSAKIAEATP